MAGITAGVKRQAKYAQMWDLEILLQHIRVGPPSSALSWTALLARAAAVFMIFIPCRPIGMLRMDTETEIWSSDYKVLQVLSHEKTNTVRGKISLVLRVMENENLSPLHLYTLLKEGAQNRGARGGLWCSELGNLYKQSSGIARWLRKLMLEANIPPEYTAYSIRHALITALFDAGLTETQVNAYTGHSHNSHTAVNSYFHMDKNWIGRMVERRARNVSEQEVERVIEEDNLRNRQEENEDVPEEEPGGVE
jgi:hypothetical protein